MTTPLRILIVEDSPEDTELMVSELGRAGFSPQWTRVEREGEYLAEIEKGPDIILSDYTLPGFSGLRAVKLLREGGSDIPFILVSGTVGEDLAIEAMQLGATDYLLKDRLARLGSAVQRALDQTQLARQRGQAQEELRRTHQALRHMLAHSPAVIYAVRIEGPRMVPVLISENIQRLLGYTAAEALHYEWWLGGLHPEDRARVLASLAHGMAQDGYATEYRIRHKDGSYRWIEDSNRVVRDAAGQPKELVGVWTDISERKRAEAALRQSEEILRQLAENINEVFWVADPARNQILYVSPAYENIWGRACGELYQSPQSWLEAIHPEERARVRQAALTKQERGEYDETFRVLRPDGAIRWIHDRGFPVRDSAGKVYRIVGTAEDITGRKKLEEDLRQSEAEFRVTFENAAIGVALVDTAGHPVKSNRALQQMLGYSQDELRGMAFGQFTHPEDLAQDLALFRELLAGEREHYQLEKRYLRKGGEVIYARLSASVVRGPDGRAQYAIAMLEDITEKKKLEVQFLRAQRLENIGSLAGGITHDLNNVLAPILMSCELLLMGALKEEERKLIGMIKSNAERGADLVKQVLSFARGAEGRRLWVQPNHLIREIFSIARETFPKSIRLQSNLPNDLWPVSGDPTQLHQVLLNLCLNARDAMPAGGELKITAENARLEADCSNVHPEAKPGTYIVIKVSDTGIGIPSEIREKLFAPFFTTKLVGLGTGLGLSTSLSIAKSHGGFIKVDSEPAKGSTFAVWLPAQSGETPSAAQAQEARFLRGHGELILVVDDEAAVRTLTKQTLEAYGYSVLTAANGPDAVSLYAGHKDEIQAVVTDIMMPVMDGVVLIRALMKINPAVRVIAPSGSAHKEFQTKVLEAGAKKFLPKPYSVEMLLATLDETLRNQ